MKMANIDSSFHFMFTEPLDSYPNGVSVYKYKVVLWVL